MQEDCKSKSTVSSKSLGNLDPVSKVKKQAITLQVAYLPSKHKALGL